MKKLFPYLKFLSILLMIVCFSFGCNKDKPFILCSSTPITKSFKVNQAQANFNKGQRIYFAFYNPKEFKSGAIRIQVLKLDNETFYKYEIEHARDVSISIKQHHYIDYVCVHNSGYYIIRIFDKANLKKPIAETDFRVN